MNRLSGEQSPYLLQHAHNPVNWFPWGDEAFAAARLADKPIFLSIGYSTCHWCHVMEHESFEHAEIAAVLNESYVAVKVDREERPDVDRVYMTFVQGTTGSGGWPMSVWLTPDLKPFYGGTYYPPTARWGRPGFVDILREIARIWQTERESLERSAESVTEQMQGAIHASVGTAIPAAAVLPPIVQQFRSSFDKARGGFGGAPKFPRPSELLFLLREHARSGDPEAATMTAATLRAMALGGMRDHIGGGFHRYSVDAEWRVPHFEKMLYDQAQLTLANIEAAQATGDAFYVDVAEDTLRYVMREMTGPEGGFFSAEDADSVPPELAAEAEPHKTEGAFYLWTSEQIDALLGDEAELVKARFGVEPEGNAPSDPQEEFVGKNLLYVARSIKELALQFDKSEDEVRATLGRARVAMYTARSERPHPHLDDKVLTAWNGLMIGAFACVARVLGALGADGRTAVEPYLQAARRAAAFLRGRMWTDETGVLLRRYRDHAGIEAYAEDYAYLIFGLNELFLADPDPRWLSWAVALQERQDALFWDAERGGWFSTTGKDPSVLVRMKEDYDGAEPTASSVSVLNLLTLSHLVERPEWSERIERTLLLFSERLEQLGRAVPMMAAALSAYHAGLTQIVIVGDEGADALSRSAAIRYRPFTLALRIDAAQQTGLSALLPWLADMKPIAGRAAAYVCRNFTCDRPVTTPQELEGKLTDTSYDRPS